MSVKIMSMVFDRYTEGGGEMLLALALADHAGDDGTRIYPSIAALAEKTRQSERTVQYQLRRMQESGWLILVSKGNGGRGMSSEYRISPDWVKGAEIAPLEKGANCGEKGAIHDIKGAIDDAKGCNLTQERVQPIAPANNHHTTIKEPSNNHKGASAEKNDGSTSAGKSSLSVADLVADGVTTQTATDFISLRLAKKSPLTPTAMTAIKREAASAGYPLENALQECVLRGWQGFKAAWVLRDAAEIAIPKRGGKPSLYESNQAAAAEAIRRLEAMEAQQ